MGRAATTTPQNFCSPLCHSTTSASLSACGALESSPYAFIFIPCYDHSWTDEHLMKSFLFSVLPPTLLLPPIVTTMLRPLTFGAVNHLPAGPTPLIFALLAQYHAAIPTVYKYRIVTSRSVSTSSSAIEEQGLVLSDKFLVYLLASQLALSSFPGSAIAASVGWMVGVAWRGEWGPGAWGKWRLPGWVVGEKKANTGQGFERLRRRLEGEGSGTGADGRSEGEARRRTLGRGILDQFRGAF